MSSNPAAPHILHVFPSLQNGGAQMRTTGIVNSLGAAFTHTFLAMDGHSEALAALRPDIRFRLADPPASKDSLTCPFRMAAILRALRPDLIVTYNWGTIDTVIAAQFTRIAPVIHTEDGFGADEAAGLKLRRVLTRRLLLNRIATTVVISRKLLEIAQTQYKLRPGKVRFIANGVDTEKFRPGGDRRLRREWGVPDDALLFGYIGRLGPEKNLPMLVRAFHRAAGGSSRLVLVGDGPMRPQVEAAIDAAGARSSVILAGPSKDPAGCLAAFDVLVMSSFTEQASLALLEGMACGLPVICTDAGDSRDMLVPAQSDFVVAVSDEDGYVHALRRMASDPDRRARFGRENRDRAVTLYTYPAMVEAYRELYRSTIASFGKKPAVLR